MVSVVAAMTLPPPRTRPISAGPLRRWTQGPGLPRLRAYQHRRPPTRKAQCSSSRAVRLQEQPRAHPRSPRQTRSDERSTRVSEGRRSGCGPGLGGVVRDPGSGVLVRTSECGAHSLVTGVDVVGTDEVGDSGDPQLLADAVTGRDDDGLLMPQPRGSPRPRPLPEPPRSLHCPHQHPSGLASTRSRASAIAFSSRPSEDRIRGFVPQRQLRLGANHLDHDDGVHPRRMNREGARGGSVLDKNLERTAGWPATARPDGDQATGDVMTHARTASPLIAIRRSEWS
jgi:hypothetical protein